MRWVSRAGSGGRVGRLSAWASAASCGRWFCRVPCAPVQLLGQARGARRINGAPQMRWCYPNGGVSREMVKFAKSWRSKPFLLPVGGCPSRGAAFWGSDPPELMAPPKCVGAIRMVGCPARWSNSRIGGMGSPGFPRDGQIWGSAAELMAPPKCVGAIRMGRCPARWSNLGICRRINGAPQMRWCYPNGTVSREMVKFGDDP